MEYIKLGNSDLNVSRICLGCMGFGDSTKGMHSWTLDEEKSTEIIKKALDEGINFFNTAIAYQSGTSEKYLGQAIKKLANREDVVIATKISHIEDAIKAIPVRLTEEEIAYLEEPYIPHKLVGVMAQNNR